MIRQRLVAGLVTATALVTFAACGSDSRSSSTTEPVATAAPATTATTTEATADVTTPDVAGSDVSVPDISVPDASTPQLTGECVELQKDLPDMSDTTNFNTADVEKSFATLQSRVPADLKDDVTTIKTALQPFYDAVDKAGGDATKAMQDPEVLKQAETAFTDPKFTAATTALEAWFEKGCPS